MLKILTDNDASKRYTYALGKISEEARQDENLLRFRICNLAEEFMLYSFLKRFPYEARRLIPQVDIFKKDKYHKDINDLAGFIEIIADLGMNCSSSTLSKHIDRWDSTEKFYDKEISIGGLDDSLKLLMVVGDFFNLTLNLREEFHYHQEFANEDTYISKVLKNKKYLTSIHEKGVASTCPTIAPYLCGENKVAYVQLGALFHDIGKNLVPASTLQKIGRLTNRRVSELEQKLGRGKDFDIIMHANELEQSKNGSLLSDEYLNKLQRLLNDEKITPDDYGQLIMPSNLTKKERDEIRIHPLGAVAVLNQIRYLPEEIINSIRYHHERYSGEGYYGLKARKIPPEALVMGVSDAFEAMLHGRPYSNKIDFDSAINELVDCTGTQFGDKDRMNSIISLLTKHRNEFYPNKEKPFYTGNN